MLGSYFEKFLQISEIVLTCSLFEVGKLCILLLKGNLEKYFKNPLVLAM